MKNFGFATLAAGALTAAFLGLAAPAQAAPAGSDTAREAISELKADGFRVYVNNPTGASLDDASVARVTPGNDLVTYRYDTQLERTVVDTVTKTVHVTVN